MIRVTYTQQLNNGPENMHACVAETAHIRNERPNWPVAMEGGVAPSIQNWGRSIPEVAEGATYVNERAIFNCLQDPANPEPARVLAILDKANACMD